MKVENTFSSFKNKQMYNVLEREGERESKAPAMFLNVVYQFVFN